MASPVKAEVVNAFVQAVVDLLRDQGQLLAEVGRPGLVTELDEAPVVSVSIDVSGQVYGPVLLAFDEQVATELIAKLFQLDIRPDLDPKIYVDAVGEISNIALGNATGALLEAGYPVELSTPRANLSSASRKLLTKTVAIPLNTPSGQVKVLIGIKPDPGEPH